MLLLLMCLCMFGNTIRSLIAYTFQSNAYFHFFFLFSLVRFGSVYKCIDLWCVLVCMCMRMRVCASVDSCVCVYMFFLLLSSSWIVFEIIELSMLNRSISFIFIRTLNTTKKIN